MFVLARTPINQINKPPVLRIFLVQILTTIMLSVLFALGEGSVAAYSSLAGGLIFALPQLYFGIVAFINSGARSIDRVIQNFYKGESAKMILIAMGFGVTFALIEPLDIFALFFTFISVLSINAFGPALYYK